MIWARVSIARGIDLGERAKPVEPSSVSFAPSNAAGEWSVSVTIEDVGRTETERSRKASRRFWEAS